MAAVGLGCMGGGMAEVLWDCGGGILSREVQWQGCDSIVCCCLGCMEVLMPQA